MRNPIKSWVRNQLIKALSDEGNELFRQMFSMINDGSPIWVGEKQRDYIDKGYAYNDLIYSIISTKFEAARSIDWVAYKVKDKKAFRQYKAYNERGDTLLKSMKLKEQALEEVETGDAYKLLEKPNDYQSFNEIVQDYFAWTDLMGNFYLYGLESLRKEGQFQSIHVAPAHMVEIIAGTQFQPVKGYSIKDWFTDVISPHKILHIKNWNPDYRSDGRHLYGMSPLKAGGRVLTLDNAGIDASATMFKNQGVRGIIHRSAGQDNHGFTIEQALQLKNKLEQSYNNPDKAGALAATNAQVGFTNIGRTPVDLGILESMQQNLQRLCNVFQVPMELFAPGSTFSNKKEARKHMITTGVIPKLNVFRNRINRWLIQPYGNYFIDYDMMSIAELQDDIEKVATMLKGMDFITDNEKRRQMDYERYDHPLADTLFVSPNRIPITMAMYDTDPAAVELEMEKIRNGGT